MEVTYSMPLVIFESTILSILIVSVLKRYIPITLFVLLCIVFCVSPIVLMYNLEQNIEIETVVIVHIARRSRDY